MTQYIDKDALVAELEKRIKETESMQPIFDQFWAGQISAFKGVLKILDTLEVKEVDFEKELDRIWFDNKLGDYFNNAAVDFARIRTICKHFFELGIKAQKGK